jgi:anti-sigma factor RsiW
MSDCQSIDASITPLIDGELSAAERERLERHLRFCASCHSRVEAERAVRSLLHGRQHALKSSCAPVALRVKCASHCQMPPTSSGGRGMTRRLMPLAAAAILIVGAGAALWYQAAAPSARVLAMELASDHVQCFDRPGPRETAAVVESALASGFGWQVALSSSESAGLELIGARQCSFDGSPVAHLMFEHDDQPMSLFMVPKASYDPAMVEAMGQQCAIWSSGDRTFVLVSNEARAEVERVAAKVQPVFH